MVAFVVKGKVYARYAEAWDGMERLSYVTEAFLGEKDMNTAMSILSKN